jgi:hypothetical protein
VPIHFKVAAAGAAHPLRENRLTLQSDTVRHNRLRENKQLFGEHLLFRSPQGLLKYFSDLFEKILKKYNSPEDPVNSTDESSFSLGHSSRSLFAVLTTFCR